ncbi:NAC domain-containing protein 68-like [Camellia sinensis]|uniref:NAC domain-containing protein 68-like n=1 Tax=Camellia sinensis TaxID=4442 RepID=UPI0010364E3A|nr:NAC domain-containing protein 68-like [Camellia sinensis]
MAANITIGYKFIPTDKELILHYLRAKAKGQPLPVEGLVNECNLYDDQELLKIFSKMRTKSKLYYYFTELKKKNGKGKRIDHMVGKGTWKGLDRVRTDEYRPVTACVTDKNYVLCVIKRKRRRVEIEQQEQPVDDSDIDHYFIEQEEPTAAVIQQELAPTDDDDHFDWDQFVWDSTLTATPVIQPEKQPTTAFIQQELAEADDNGHFDWD